MRFTLTKRVRTVGKEMLLTHDGGVYTLQKHDDKGHVSRLTNWRSLLMPGREVEVLEYKDQPVVARLRVQDGDVLLWDSEPLTLDQEWVPWWMYLHRDRIKEPKEKPQEADDALQSIEGE